MPVDENNIKVQHACIKFKHNKIENWRKDQIERTWKKQNPKMPSTRRTLHFDPFDFSFTQRVGQEDE